MESEPHRSIEEDLWTKIDVDNLTFRIVLTYRYSDVAAAITTHTHVV